MLNDIIFERVKYFDSNFKVICDSLRRTFKSVVFLFQIKNWDDSAVKY